MARSVANVVVLLNLANTRRRTVYGSLRSYVAISVVLVLFAIAQYV